MSWGSTSRSWKKMNTVKAQTSSYSIWIFETPVITFMHVKKALTKGWTQGTIIFYHKAQNDSFVIFLQITANLTLINSIQTKFSSFRQHMQTSIKKEDSSTQPLIVLPDKHHAKNVLTSITLDTRYGRVLFTLIFSAFSCKRDGFIKQIFSF